MILSLKLRDLITLAKFSSKRLQSEADYRIFQSFQAKLLLGYLSKYGVSFPGKKLLDLGSGIAGYALIFAQQGAQVFCLDLQPVQIKSPDNIVIVRGDALAIPFGRDQFDFIFCASLIEHVHDPLRLLNEVERSLKPGGLAYLSFPPYYSPKGGHEFSPYHYLGERLALRLVSRKDKVPDWVADHYQSQEQTESFANLYQGWGLFRMTISKFRRLIRSSNLELINVSTRYFSVSAIRWPVLGELLTWHAQFLLRKRH
jgi:SAM-dependent methyltransferase